MGWGTEDVVGAGGQVEGEAAVAVKATAGEEQNEKVWCRQDNNPLHDSSVELSSRARMCYHNCLFIPL